MYALFSADYSGFESILVEFKMVSHQTGNFGRVRSLSQVMLTGNKRGLAGFALFKSPTGRGGQGFQRAVNKAGLRLTQIELYEGRTGKSEEKLPPSPLGAWHAERTANSIWVLAVFHDFFTQFGDTRLFVYQRPPGFGIKAHRVIKAACEVLRKEKSLLLFYK